MGQNTWEEVDLGRLTDPATGENGLRGANLGWATCEGDFVQGSTTQPCPPALGQTAPFFAYQHSGDPAQTGCAIIGGFVVRDPTLTDLAGRYLYGDLCRTDLRTLDLGPGGPDPRPAGLATSTASLISFGEDARGCVYALADHTVYRVAASASDPFACPNPSRPRSRGSAAARRRRRRAEAGRDRRAARRAAAATGRAEEAAAEAAVVGRAQAAAEAAAAAAARAPSTPPRRACAPPAPWPAGAAPCASPSPATRPAT